MDVLPGGRLRLLRLRVWLAERLRPTEWQITLIWAAIAGVAGALGSVAFRGATEDVHRALTGSTEGVVESFRIMPWWARLAVPTVGGLLAGGMLLLGRRWAGEEASTDYMEAIVIGTGRVPLRASFGRIGASLFSIGSGGSIGREGPMVQLAAVLASWIGRWKKFSPPRLRLLVACGAAAGIASAYNAPIAGAFFVAEIVLGSLSMDSLGPLVAASVAAALTIRALGGAHALYQVPRFTLGSLWEMGPYLGLGLLAGTLASWFLRSLRLAEQAFARLRWPIMLRLAAGGLIVGALAIKVPEVCGNGYSVVLDILNGHIVWSALILIMVCKWLATAGSFGSGAPGGVFTPSLFMGASAGLLFGTGIHALWPTAAAEPQAFALVGMGAFLSAATQAPVMAVILLFEMTLSYDIILPLLACSVVSYFVAKGLEGGSLYSEALRRRAAQAPALEAVTARIGQLMKANPPTVRVDAGFAEIARLFLSLRVNNLYVIDAEGKFRGVVSLHDIKPYLHLPDLAGLILASDVMRRFPTVGPDQPVEEALSSFLHLEAERLPVVDAAQLLVGSLAKSDLLLAVGERLRVNRPAAP